MGLLNKKMEKDQLRSSPFPYRVCDFNATLVTY